MMMRFLRKKTRTDANEEKNDFTLWWESNFTIREQEHILSKYQPMVMSTDAESAKPSIENIIRSDGTLCIKLCHLATWFMSPSDDLPLARKILQKGIENGEDIVGNTLDRHFIYHSIIGVYYRDRNRDLEALGLAIEACQKQIALAPAAAQAFEEEYPSQSLPGHRGFEQLAIVRERERDYTEAIRLSEEAVSQGWDGDWAKRITRCQKRLGMM